MTATLTPVIQVIPLKEQDIIALNRHALQNCANPSAILAYRLTCGILAVSSRPPISAPEAAVMLFFEDGYWHRTDGKAVSFAIYQPVLDEDLTGDLPDENGVYKVPPLVSRSYNMLAEQLNASVGTESPQ